MQYNPLGQSQIKISAIGLGCMSLKSDNEKTSLQIIDTAIDAGVNYFDTADLYEFGNNEILLGKALKNKRKDVVIASKVGNKWSDGKSDWTWDVSKAYIQKAIEDSLIRLQTDYLDLYQIHGGTNQDNYDEVVDTLEKLVTEGKIRTYGISSIRPNVFLKYAKSSAIVSNLMQYSLLDTRPEDYLAELKNNGVSVLSRGALAQGLLLDKPAKKYLLHSEEEVKSVQEIVQELADKYGISKQAIALSYVLQEPAIASAVIGVRTTQQMDELLQAYTELNNTVVDFSAIQLEHKIKYQEHLV